MASEERLSPEVVELLGPEGKWQLMTEGVVTCSGCFLLAARWYSDGVMDFCLPCAEEFLIDARQ